MQCSDKEEPGDNLPLKMQETVVARLRSDAIMCVVMGVLVFGVHCSTVFTKLQPILSEIVWIVPAGVGLLLHYIVPQLRKQLPWLCFSHPLIRSAEYDQFEVHEAARLMWFEKMYLWLTIIEKHVLQPVNTTSIIPLPSTIQTRDPDTRPIDLKS